MAKYNLYCRLPPFSGMVGMVQKGTHSINEEHNMVLLNRVMITEKILNHNGTIDQPHGFTEYPCHIHRDNNEKNNTQTIP